MTTADVANGPTPEIACDDRTMYSAYDAAAARPSRTPTARPPATGPIVSAVPTVATTTQPTAVRDGR